PRVKEKRRLGPLQVQPIQKTVYQGGLARSHLTGEGDEALARLDAVHQSGQRFLNLLGQKQIARIRVYIERIFLQPKEALVHDLWASPFLPVSAKRTAARASSLPR